MHGYYRLFENNDIFINVEVDKLNISKKLKEFLIRKNFPFKNLDNEKLITEGYWNKCIFIKSEGNSLTYDLFNNKYSLNKRQQKYFTFELLDKRCNKKLANVPVNDTIIQSINIKWKHSVYGNQCITVDLYENPQIQNSIKFNSELIKDTDSIGLLVKNYKSSYMALKNIEHCKNANLKNKIYMYQSIGTEVFYESSVKMKNENL